MRQKTYKASHGDFSFRARIGECEIELDGSREEVMKALEDLPNLMSNVHRAFETAKPKKVTTLTVKTEPIAQEKAPSQEYPGISATENCDEAVLRILETDWGKWRPRTIDELKEVLKANQMDCPGRMLNTVLAGLVKQGKIRRWNTDTGNVYILAEKEALNLREK